ncbi:MAG: regulatory protein RecX [Clostridia bacterium]|nr:regulatory protein RecX [Clostridia bacterium]
MNYSDISRNNKELTFDMAKEKALRLLEFRSHTEKELFNKLKRAGAKDEDILKTLDFCREYKFIDDENYAKKKARDLKNLKKFGKRRIELELLEKGIDSELVTNALYEIEDDTEELYNMIVKKYGTDLDRKNSDKCIRFFMYRGYNLSDIKDCIERIKGEQNGM